MRRNLHDVIREALFDQAVNHFRWAAYGPGPMDAFRKLYLKESYEALRERFDQLAVDIEAITKEEELRAKFKLSRRP